MTFISECGHVDTEPFPVFSIKHRAVGASEMFSRSCETAAASCTRAPEPVAILRKPTGYSICVFSDGLL